MGAAISFSEARVGNLSPIDLPDRYCLAQPGHLAITADDALVNTAGQERKFP
jgi:hypothetical protein